MKNSCLIRQMALAALLSASLAVPFRASAETDTFDNYTDFASFTNAGWVLSQIGPVATTFPEVGTGKGLRLQALPLADRARRSESVTARLNTRISTSVWIW